MLRHRLSFVIKALLSIALVWYLFQGVDMQAAWASAQAIDSGFLAATFLLFFLQILVGALRWQGVIHALGQRLPLKWALSYFHMGLFFNIVLPGAVGGDALRMWKATRFGLDAAKAIHSVVLERITTLLALFLMVAALQPLLIARVGSFPGSWVFPLLSAIGLIGIGLLMILDRLPSAWAKHRFSSLADSTRALFLAPRRGGVAVALAAFGHANLSLAVWCLAQGLNLEISVIDCLILVPPVILMITLPISIAGWGVRESSMVVAFGLIGVEADKALVLSVIFGLVNMVVCLPGGVLWLMDRGKQQGKMV